MATIHMATYGGTYNSLTPNTGTVLNAVNVDDGDTTIVYGGPGSFTLNLSGGIYAVSNVYVYVRAKGGDEENMSGSILWRSAGVNSSPPHYLSLTYETWVLSQIATPNDPATGVAWTSGAFYAAELCIWDLLNTSVTYLYVSADLAVASGSLGQLLQGAFGLLVAVGLEEMPRLCRALARRRGIELDGEEQLRAWRELREARNPSYFFRPALMLAGR
jgi:hypothetical protein